MDEFHGVQYQIYNKERPMIIAGVTLQTTMGEMKAHEIFRRIMLCLDLWEAGHHAALLADTVAES